jgi:hypothetical protein
VAGDWILPGSAPVGADLSDEAVGLGRLSSSLWEEREMLVGLLFKLDEANLILAAGLQNWLPRATAEVGEAAGRVREAEARRVEAVLGVAGRMGLSGEPTLAEIAAATGEPWSSALIGHREALIGVMEGIQRAAERNRHALSAHLSAVTEALAVLGGAGDPAGSKDEGYVPAEQLMYTRGAGARVVDARA